MLKNGWLAHLGAWATRDAHDCTRARSHISYLITNQRIFALIRNPRTEPELNMPSSPDPHDGFSLCGCRISVLRPDLDSFRRVDVRNVQKLELAGNRTPASCLEGNDSTTELPARTGDSRTISRTLDFLIHNERHNTKQLRL